MVLRRVYIILLLFFTVDFSKGQTIYPYRHFDHREYGSGRKVFCIDQSSEGTIFIGTSTALSKFDGERWQTGKLPGEKTVFWMDLDPQSGNVFVGSSGEFGYFKPDMSYHSLSTLVDSLATDYGTIWEVDATSHGVYFRSTKYIFRYHEEQLTRINATSPSSAPFDIIFNINDTIYTRIREVGLATIYHGRLELVNEEEPFLLKSNSFMPHPEGILIATRRNGLFLLSGQVIKNVPTEADNYFSEHHIYHASALKNGDYAFATLTGGVVILAKDGQVKHTITKNNYGVNQATGYVFEDDSHGLWVGLNLGVARIDLSSSIVNYQFDGLEDYSKFQVHDNKLYFATVSGLYAFEEGTEAPRRVNGFPNLVDRIFRLEGELFAADFTSTYSIKGFEATEAFRKAMHAMIKVDAQQFNHLAGGQDGILTLKRDGNDWETSFYDTEAPNNVIDLFKSSEGIWGLSTSTGLFKYAPDTTIYYSLSGPIGLKEYQEDLLIVTKEGFFRFDSIKNAFVPERGLNNRLPKDFFGIQDVHISNDSTWVIYYNQFNRLTGNVFVGDSLVKKLPVFEVFPEDLPQTQVVGDKLFVSNNQQIFSYQSSIDKNRIDPVSAFIVCDELTTENQYTLAYQLAPLRFNFSTHSTNSSGKNYYRYKIYGYDTDWSAWSNQNYLEIANLEEGDYNLQLEAMTPERQVVQGELSFTILPPWYRTLWAYLGYIIIAALAVSLLFKWRFRYLEGMRNRLEKIIKERTSEISDQKLALEKSLSEREALLAEIHHRVRNNLQVISSIFNMQLKEAKTEELAQQIFAGQSRIKAMTLIHQKLHQDSDAVSIEFKSYVLELFREINKFYSNNKNIACKIEGDKEKIEMDTAIPLGLILNEMISNSLQHGFEGREAGLITICLSRSDTASYLLKYHDDGVGLPSGLDFNKGSTLGAKLITLLTRQLGGNLKISDGSGVGFELRFQPIHSRN